MSSRLPRSTASPDRVKRAVSSRHAFTLIELLVVVAILAVLVSLLVPILGDALMKTRTAGCQYNMRHLALAMLSYTVGHGNWVPDPKPGADPDDPPNWAGIGYERRLESYLGGRRSAAAFLRCPLETDPDRDYSYMTMRSAMGGGYGNIEGVFSRLWIMSNTNRWRDPSLMFLFIETNPYDTAAFGSGSWYGALWDWAPPGPYLHDGQKHALHGDQHVELRDDFTYPGGTMSTNWSAGEVFRRVVPR